MSKSSSPRVISRRADDIDTPGVVIEVDQDEAEQMGAFTENAISPEEATESNMEVGS